MMNDIKNHFHNGFDVILNKISFEILSFARTKVLRQECFKNISNLGLFTLVCFRFKMKTIIIYTGVSLR